MKQYRVKALVEAEQFHKDTLPWPEGVEKAKLQGHRRNATGFYRVGDPIIHAVRGTGLVKEGDWVVKGPRGFYLFSDGDFQETYEPV